MGALGPDAVVDQPEPTPALHSLRASTPPARDPSGTRWEMGFEFPQRQCGQGGIWVPCVDSVPLGIGLGGSGSGSGEQTKGADGDAPDFVKFVPYVVTAGFRCTSRGFQAEDYEGDAIRELEAVQDKQMEHEFWTGDRMTGLTESINGIDVLIENPSLEFTTELDGIVNPLDAGDNPIAVNLLVGLRLLTQALANCGPGSAGVIHATPYVAEAWAELDAIKEEGPNLMTKTRGNIVVSGGGYPGTGPDIVSPDPILADDNLVWAYATGPVEHRLGAINLIPATGGARVDRIRDAMDRRTNTVEFIAERFAAAVWNTCCTFAVLIDVCNGEC